MKKNNSAGEVILSIVSAVWITLAFFEAILGGNIIIFIWGVFTLIFSLVSKKIGESKNIAYGFYLGWFLGIIGLLIVMILPNENIKNIYNHNKYEDLGKLQKLKEIGAISEIEFEKEKQKLLK